MAKKTDNEKEEKPTRIIRSSKDNNYTMIKNDVFSSNLSWAATGLLCWILSQKDTWEIIPNALAKKKNTTKSSVYKLLAELKEAGFIVGQRTREGDYIYTVYESPVEKEPNLKNPNQAFPNQENPNQENPNQENQDALIITNSIAITNCKEITAFEFLKSEGVSETTAKAILNKRRLKREPNDLDSVKTFVKAIKMELTQLGCGLDEALTKFVASFYGSFQAAHYQSGNPSQSVTQPNQPPVVPKMNTEAVSMNDVVKNLRGALQ